MSTAKSINEPNYHYFIGSCLHWNVGMKVHKLMVKQKRKDRGKKRLYQASSYALWRVPLPLSSTYNISNYSPDVDGAELILKEDY